MNLASLSGVTKAVAALGVGGVLAGAIALGASGGKGAGSAPPAQVVAATATSVPEQAPEPRLDPGKPRTDCPDGWAFYNDPDGRFTICYPRSLSLISERPANADLGMLLTLSEAYHGNPEEDRFVLHIAWSQRGFFLQGASSPALCAADTGSTSSASLREFRQQALSSRIASGCHWRGRRGQLRNAGELHLDLPFSRAGNIDGGYIQIAVNYTGSDYMRTLARAQPVIDTIQLP